MSNEKLVLLSGGGFDSISALTLYHDLIDCVLSIDFGQKAAEGEWVSNDYFAKKYSIPHIHLKTVQLSDFLRHPTLKHSADNSVMNGQWQQHFEADRLEARNLLLLSHAVVVACGRGVGGVMTGFHRESTDRFPDALPRFYELFKETALAATEYRPLQFRAPLQEEGWGRVDVLERALVQDPQVWYAYTCYGTPQMLASTPMGTIPCRRCVHCFKRREVKEELTRRGIPASLPLDNLDYNG